MNVSSFVTMPGFFFCAGVVGATASPVHSTGQVTYTVARTSGQAAGGYTVTLGTANPLGSAYIVILSGQYNVAVLNGGVSASSFKVMTYTVGTSTLADSVFHFAILAY